MFRSSIRSKMVMAVAAPIVVATVALLGTPQVALGASAGNPSAIPVVVSFTATRTTVPDAGGNIVLGAQLKYASSCRITVSPTLKGFSRSFSCSSDRVRQSITLRANKSPTQITYTFGLIVKNRAGSATATNVVVTEGIAPPPISFTTPTGNPTTLVFPDEGVFVADNPLIVTVHNDSSTTQVITSVAIGTVGDPSDFNLNRNNCGHITPHANCSLAVQFQPSGAGTRTGVVDILDSSWGNAGTTAPLKLQGVGVWATATVENANIRGNILTFPIQYGVGTPSPEQYVTLLNSGKVPLYIGVFGTTATVGPISVSGGESSDFSAAPDTCTSPTSIVSVGQSCTFEVAFDPSGAGTRTTSIVIDDNTLGTQTQLKVRGVGVYSTDPLAINGDTAEPSPISYIFNSSSVGTEIYATLRIRNTSRVTVVFSGVSSTGIDPTDFAVALTTPPTCAGPGDELAAGRSCNVQLSFDPLAQGARTATLHIGDNSPDGGEIVNVSGTGK
jgi:hypothetical protein